MSFLELAESPDGRRCSLRVSRGYITRIVEALLRSKGLSEEEVPDLDQYQMAMDYLRRTYEPEKIEVV